METSALEKSFKDYQQRLGIAKEEQLDLQGLRKSGQMHKVRLSQNNYQLVAESGGQSPEVLMNNYNEALDSEKRALVRMAENNFYPRPEMPVQSNDALSTLLAQLQSSPDLQRQLLENLLLGATRAERCV